MPQLVDRWNRDRNIPQGRFQRPPAEVCIAAKPPHTVNLKTEIELQILFETGTLRFRQQPQDHLAALLFGEHPGMARRQIAPQAHGRRESRAKMNIRSPLGNRGAKQVKNIREVVHFRNRLCLETAANAAQTPAKLRRIRGRKQRRLLGEASLNDKLIVGT